MLDFQAGNIQAPVPSSVSFPSASVLRFLPTPQPASVGIFHFAFSMLLASLRLLPVSREGQTQNAERANNWLNKVLEAFKREPVRALCDGVILTKCAG